MKISHMLTNGKTNRQNVMKDMHASTPENGFNYFITYLNLKIIWSLILFRLALHQMRFSRACS